MRTIALAVLASLCAVVVRAQGAPPPAGAEENYVRYMQSAEDLGPDPDLEVQHYHRQLNLTDEQKKKVRQVFVEQRVVYKKSSDLRKKFQAETRALHERILELNKKFQAETKAIDDAHAAALEKVRALLTPEQKSSFSAMWEQRERQEREWRARREEESRRREMGPGGAGKGGYMGFGDPPPADDAPKGGK